MSNNVFLVGPMGSGKSAVGRRLSKDLGCEFFDSDSEIERRTGVDIAYIFDKEGESGFRRRELEVVTKLAEKTDIVLATGGGAILMPENRKALEAHGTVVYLHATVEQQVQRTRRAKNRPLLEGVDRPLTLKELMKVRDPLYRSIADIVVDTDGRTVASVAAEIRTRLSGS